MAIRWRPRLQVNWVNCKTFSLCRHERKNCRFRIIHLTPPSANRDIAVQLEAIPQLLRESFDDIFLLDEGFPMNYCHPEKVVHFFVQIGNAFEDAMNQLPWKARQDMIQLLIERGRDVVATYPETNLRPLHPCKTIRATAVK